MLTSEQISDLECLHALAANPAAWDRSYRDPRWQSKVLFEFPQSELFDPLVGAALSIYAAKQGVVPSDIKASDRFDTQGLQQEYSIRISYRNALLLAIRMQLGRFNIKPGKPIKSFGGEAIEGKVSSLVAARR